MEIIEAGYSYSLTTGKEGIDFYEDWKKRNPDGSWDDFISYLKELEKDKI